MQSQEKYTVTRSAGAGHLVLANDASISRTHAHLYPTKDHIKITDCSKYGTYVNANIAINVPLEPNREHQLNAQDRIQFGRFENQWVVELYTITILTSKLSPAEKTTVKRDIDALDGVILEEFSKNCTHLTIRNLTATIKVLQSLAYAIPIVSPDYWKAYLKAIRTRTPMPNPDKFPPTVTEPYMSPDMFVGINVNRRRVFAGKTFVFMLKKHQKMFETLIEMAGGQSISLGETQTRKNYLRSPNVIAVRYQPSTQSQTSQDITNVADYLSTRGLRLIPDCEIGLAIIHCSTEKFCNPKYKVEHNFDIPSELLHVAAAEVLAENTPPTLSNNAHTSGALNMDIVEVMESIVYESASTESSKKMVSSDDVIETEPTTVKSSSNLFNDSADEEQLVANETPTTTTETKRKHSTEVGEYERAPKRLALDDAVSKTLPSPMVQSTSGWLSKIVATPQNSQPSKGIAVEPPTSRKRPFDLLQDDSDDENEDLFQFNVKTSSKKKTKQSANNKDDNDNVFQFPSGCSSAQSSAGPSQRNRAATGKQSVVSKAPPTPTTKSFCQPINPIPLPTSGWLSKSFKNSLKLNEKEESKEESADDTTPDWIKSIQNGFQVKVVSMNLTTRSIDQNVSNNRTVSGQPNFKTFVKKMNYRPQTTVIRTGVE